MDGPVDRYPVIRGGRWIGPMQDVVLQPEDLVRVFVGVIETEAPFVGGERLEIPGEIPQAPAQAVRTIEEIEPEAEAQTPPIRRAALYRADTEAGYHDAAPAAEVEG